MTNSSVLSSDSFASQEQLESPFVVEIEDSGQRQKSLLTFEENVQRTETLLKHNPSFRHVFRRILKQCENGAVILSDLEELVANQPNYAALKTPPYYPIHWLNETFALEELYLNEQGVLLTADDVTGLSEDEFDDLVVAYAYRTTDIGTEAARRFSPNEKLKQLLKDEQDRTSTYLEVLHFLEKEKKSFASIEALLRNRPVLQNTSRDGVKLQPSLFVDKLEATGVIAYDGGWCLTPEGKEMLATLE